MADDLSLACPILERYPSRPGSPQRSYLGRPRGGLRWRAGSRALSAERLRVAVDTLFCFVAAALLILISIAIVPLLFTIARKLPRLASGILFGCAVIIALVTAPVGAAVGPIACLAAGALGATIATFASGALKLATARKKIATAVLFALALTACKGLVVFLSYDSPTDELASDLAKFHPASPAPDQLRLSNPGEPGPFQTRVVY